jgi:hypothetical protein
LGAAKKAACRQDNCSEEGIRRWPKDSCLSQRQEEVKVEEVDGKTEGGGDAEVDDNADAQSEAEDEDTRTLKKLLTSLPNLLLQRTSPPGRYPHRGSSRYGEAMEIQDAFMEKQRNMYTWVDRARAVHGAIIGMEYGQSSGYSRREEQTYLVRIWLAMQRIISGLDGGLAEMQREH